MKKVVYIILGVLSFPILFFVLRNATQAIYFVMVWDTITHNSLAVFQAVGIAINLLTTIASLGFPSLFTFKQTNDKNSAIITLLICLLILTIFTFINVQVGSNFKEAIMILIFPIFNELKDIKPLR